MLAGIWQDMFVVNLPLIEKVLRPVVIYVFLVAALKLTGKREIAQLNPFDLVVLLMLANTVQNSIIGDDNSVTGGMIGAVTLLATNYFVVRYLFDHPKLDRLVEGEPGVLMENGKICHPQCKHELITVAELEQAARRQGIASLDEVERAVLEPGGTLSFIAKKPTPEATRHDELLARLDALTASVAELRAAGKSV